MEHGGSIFEALNGHIYGNMISSNQTLVLGHGFGSNQSVWHYVIPFLACYFKVVVFDLAFVPGVRPGLYDPNKYSNYNGYANDLLGFLDELDVNKAVYLGHSMSAMIGCIAAVKKPQLFHQLILLGGSPRYLNDKGYKGGFERSEINTILQEINQNYTAWVQAFAPKAVGMKDTNAISEFEQSLGKMDRKTAVSAAGAVFLSDWRWILRQVPVPTAIIQSETDYVVPENVAQYMQKEIMGGDNNKDVKVHILKTQGHFPQLTAHTMLLNVLKLVLEIKD